MLLVKKSKFMIYVKKAKIRALLRADIQKVRSLKIPEFWAPPPSSFALIHFRAPPPPLPSPQGTFVSAWTHPLPLNFYTCEI